MGDDSGRRRLRLATTPAHRRPSSSAALTQQQEPKVGVNTEKSSAATYREEGEPAECGCVVLETGATISREEVKALNELLMAALGDWGDASRRPSSSPTAKPTRLPTTRSHSPRSSIANLGEGARGRSAEHCPPQPHAPSTTAGEDQLSVGRDNSAETFVALALQLSFGACVGFEGGGRSQLSTSAARRLPGHPAGRNQQATGTNTIHGPPEGAWGASGGGSCPSRPEDRQQWEKQLHSQAGRIRVPEVSADEAPAHKGGAKFEQDGRGRVLGECTSVTDPAEHHVYAQGALPFVPSFDDEGGGDASGDGRQAGGDLHGLPVEREGGLGVDGDANEDEVQVIQERQAEGRAGARGQGGKRPREVDGEASNRRQGASSRRKSAAAAATGQRSLSEMGWLRTSQQQEEEGAGGRAANKPLQHCPICGKEFPTATTNSEVNLHIDSCLSLLAQDDGGMFS